MWRFKWRALWTYDLIWWILRVRQRRNILNMLGNRYIFFQIIKQIILLFTLTLWFLFQGVLTFQWRTFWSTWTYSLSWIELDDTLLILLVVDAHSDNIIALLLSLRLFLLTLSSTKFKFLCRLNLFFWKFNVQVDSTLVLFFLKFILNLFVFQRAIGIWNSSNILLNLRF